MPSKKPLNLAKLPPRIAELFRRLKGHEHLELELKSAQGGLPKEIWPTVSAFANTRGGWIVLGFVEHGGVPTAEGVMNASTRLQEFTDQLNNPQKISYRACGAEDATVETVGRKQFVFIRVPAAPRKHRPVYLNDNPYHGTYVRRHGGDYHCQKPEVDRMIREASDVGADTHVLERYDSDDLDAETLAHYRRRYQTQDPGSPWNKYSDQEYLKAIRAFRVDRDTGREGLTVAGLLLLGKPEALREWRGHHMIDYRAMAQNADPEARWTDRVVWEGNLLGAFDIIYPRLVQGLAVPFRLENGRRVDETAAHVALREALVNLLVHADYAETTPSLIIRSTEGYFFRNPGSSRVPELDLFSGDRSDPRNPELVKMFRLIGLAEEAGTGIPRIIESWRALGFRLPLIDTGTERYEFTLDLRHAHLLSEEDRVWLQSLGGGEWTEAEQLALVYAKHHGDIDNQTIRELTGEHAWDVTKMLGNLRGRGFLQMIGLGPKTRYQLGPSALGSSATIHGAYEPLLSSLSGEGESPSDIVESPSDIVESPSDMQIILWESAKVARENRHLDPAVRDGLIIQLCSRAPLSLHEIAGLLARSTSHIREVVQPLLTSGRLRYLYEGQPSHPGQKYVATQASAGSAPHP